MTKELDYLAKVFGEATPGPWEYKSKYIFDNSSQNSARYQTLRCPYDIVAYKGEGDQKDFEFIAICGTLKDEIKAVIEAAHKVTEIEDKFGSENSIFSAIHELSRKLQDLKSKIAGMM